MIESTNQRLILMQIQGNLANKGLKAFINSDITDTT